MTLDGPQRPAYRPGAGRARPEAWGRQRPSCCSSRDWRAPPRSSARWPPLVPAVLRWATPRNREPPWAFLWWPRRGDRPSELQGDPQRRCGEAWAQAPAPGCRLPRRLPISALTCRASCTHGPLLLSQSGAPMAGPLRGRPRFRASSKAERSGVRVPVSPWRRVMNREVRGPAWVTRRFLMMPLKRGAAPPPRLQKPPASGL